MSTSDVQPDHRTGGRGLLRQAWRFIKPVWDVGYESYEGLNKHDGLMVASAIAYSLVFAIFPFLLFMVGLAAALGGADLADFLTREAFSAMPSYMAQSIEPQLKAVLATHQQGSFLTFGLLGTLLSITSGIESIRDGLNRAYGCQDRRNIFRKRLSSLLFVFGGIFFLIAISVLAIALPVWLAMVEPYFPHISIYSGLITVGRHLLLLVILGVMIASMHLFLTARERHLKQIAPGVVMTLALWWLAGQAFGIYLSRISNFSATYAGLAGTIALLFFLYILAVISLWGAEINRAIALHFGKKQDLCTDGRS
ncbi:membrane protein [Faunimonas pinastri]|uniref:Membrane protein n=1 Tax=Faunimonas pinastri TaxID=1855383 RepID=A0A1H9HUI8_9HYPH|nr:YihY/virulence factor BrkB family protein [Faunimonas pinastri]SEQ65986.1 membrane protein [Faunimonas pinastri]